MVLILLWKLLPPLPHLPIKLTFSLFTSLEFPLTSQLASETLLRFVPPALWLLARSGLTEHPCSKLFSFDFKSLKMVFQPGPGSRDSRSKWPSAHQPPSSGQSTPVWIPLWLVFHSVLRLLSQTQLPFLLFLQLKSHFWFCSFFKFSLLLTPALTHSGMHTCTNTGTGMCAHSTSLGRKSWWLS